MHAVICCKCLIVRKGINKMPKLQPLRIPAGWEVILNKFLEFDKENYDEDNGTWINLTQDITYLKRKNRQYVVGIDLGWYPDLDPNGVFHIQVIINENWSEPVLEFITRDRKEVVDIIENLLIKYCNDYAIYLELKQHSKKK